MNREILKVLVLAASWLMVAEACAFPAKGVLSQKHDRPIRHDDLAFAGQVLEAPLALINDGVFIDVLNIERVRCTPKNIPKPRAFALGSLSLSSMPGTGNAVVQLRITVDGKPEPPVFSTTVLDGSPTTFSGGIPCNAFPADGLNHTVTLQVAITGTRQVTVDTVTLEFRPFDLFGYQPNFSLMALLQPKPIYFIKTVLG